MEDPRNFPRAWRVLTEVCAGPGLQKSWPILGKANFFLHDSSTGFFEDEINVHLHQFYSGWVPVFMQPSLHRALN